MSEKVLSALIISIGAVLSSFLISAAIRQNSPEVEISEVSRWTLMGTIEGGYNTFDSVTGRICSVPNGNLASFTTPICTPAPSKD